MNQINMSRFKLVDTQDSDLHKGKLKDLEMEGYILNEELSDKIIKDIATKFFYHWYNSPGTNTGNGFNEWFKTYKTNIYEI